MALHLCFDIINNNRYSSTRYWSIVLVHSDEEGQVGD